MMEKKEKSQSSILHFLTESITNKINPSSPNKLTENDIPMMEVLNNAQKEGIDRQDTSNYFLSKGSPSPASKKNIYKQPSFGNIGDVRNK